MSFIAPVILGVVIYQFWQKDWKSAALILGILLTQKIAEVIKEEKLAITKAKLH